MDNAAKTSLEVHRSARNEDQWRCIQHPLRGYKQVTIASRGVIWLGRYRVDLYGRGVSDGGVRYMPPALERSRGEPGRPSAEALLRPRGLKPTRALLRSTATGPFACP